MKPSLRSAFERKVLVCVGSGGVGKTTTAAAVGLQAAIEGRKVLVCTIDPAKRLANSMGLDSLGNAEARVPDEAFAPLDRKPKGELWAMMLDLKRSWDEVIERYAPTPAQRTAILQNRFYQQLSTVLAGSHEYVAMEKLHALHQQGRYDLIVLDTPPTTHALDFLDAPGRVIDFLGNDVAKILTNAGAAAGKAGFRVLQAGSVYVSRVLARFTGAAALEELARFMNSLSGMYEGFQQRAAQVRALLSGEQTGFVLVSSPSPMVINEALHFHQKLKEAGMYLGAVAVNRVNPDFLGGRSLDKPSVLDIAQRLDAPRIPGLEPLAERLWGTLQAEQVLASLDQTQLERLRKACAPTQVIEVPRLDHDVHDLAGLWEIARYLFARDEPATSVSPANANAATD